MGTFSQYQYPHTQCQIRGVRTLLRNPGANDAEAVKKLIEKIEELKAAVGVKKTIAEYGVDEKYFLDTLDDDGRAGIRRPVHRRKPEIPADERDQGDVFKSLLR